MVHASSRSSRSDAGANRLCLEHHAGRSRCSLAAPPGPFTTTCLKRTCAASCKHPASMIGSDGLPNDPRPHPRLWGTFPRVLGYYCRDQGIFSLAQAVHKNDGHAGAAIRIGRDEGESLKALTPTWCCSIRKRSGILLPLATLSAARKESLPYGSTASCRIGMEILPANETDVFFPAR